MVLFNLLLAILCPIPFPVAAADDSVRDDSATPTTTSPARIRRRRFFWPSTFFEKSRRRFFANCAVVVFCKNQPTFFSKATSACGKSKNQSQIKPAGSPFAGPRNHARPKPEPPRYSAVHTCSSAAHFSAGIFFPMTRSKRKVGIWAVIIGLIALSFSACSSAPAPVVYADRAPPPIARHAVPLDLTTTPFDAYTVPRILYDQPPSECVPFARNISGVAIWGDAVTWWSQAEGRYARSGRPTEGSVLVLRGWQTDTRGHVAVVKAILSPRLVRVDHANWLHGGEVSLDVPVIDVSPQNDWSEVRVWHIPGGYWGGRAYQTQGFIHPIGMVATASR